MRCISIINFKGGVGKSSLAMNLGHLLALSGYQVLLIDCDLQANSSSLLATYEPPTLTHFLQGQASFDAVVRPARQGLYVIPSDRDLNVAAAYIHARRNAYYTLRNTVWQVRGCDFVLFDHSPGYTPVTEAALLASREILIPCELEPFAVQGLFNMFQKLEQTMSDQQLTTTGIIPWKVDRRYLMTIKYLSDLKKAFGHLVAPLVRSDATIPRAQAIASYLKAVRGMNCEPEQVMIMTGMHQTLALVCKMVLTPGETVCMEDPGPVVVQQILTDAGAVVVPLAVDGHGLSVERLAPAEQGGKSARLVYITPSHQYPLGVTMSLSRRLALLQWAARTGAWIVEDDYDSEYRYAGRPLAALQGLDQVGCVLYMGTFSKVLFPALRLSYLVVPAASRDLFARGRAALGRQAPLMEQVVLTAFFTEGHFARHLRRMNGIYQERQATLIEAVRQQLAGELEIKPNATGLHVMGWLPPGVDDRHVWQLAQVRGVDVPPLSAHALCPQPRGGLVLGYACVSPPEIRAGVDRLAMALEAMRRERRR